MVKIFIDPGHGGKDPGAVGFGLKEKDLTLKISLKIRDILQKEYSNVDVKLSRTTDIFLSLAQRTNAANSWNADFLLSVHINATPSGYGYEDWVYERTTNSKSIAAQNVINAEVIKATGWRNRGKKRGNLHMVRESKMASVLTESGFIDNPNDAKLLKDDTFLDKVARGHCDGIAKAFNLKRKAVLPEKEETPMEDKEKNARADKSFQSAQDFVKANDISDGTYPRRPITRQEVWAMLERMDRILNK